MGKIIESQYIDIFPIINKILDIGRRLSQIIGDLKELLARLSISKWQENLSFFGKKYLSYTPTEGTKILVIHQEGGGYKVDENAMMSIKGMGIIYEGGEVM